MKVKGIEIKDEDYDYGGLEKSYGLDIESELISILSNQIASEIDKEIINNLMGLEETRVDRIRKLLEDIKHSDEKKI